MKKFIMIVVGPLFFLGCASKEVDSFTELTSNAEAAAVIEIQKPEQIAVIADPSPYLQVQYRDVMNNVTYTGNFELYKNENHPKGYVIIKTFDVTKNNTVRKYEIKYNVKEYIETIHNLSNFQIDCINDQYNLASEIKGKFRTIEAMIMAANQEKNLELLTSEVKKAGERMTGRKFGISK